MLKKIDLLLDSAVHKTGRLTEETERYVRSHHSNFHRLKEMIRISAEYRESRAQNRPYQPELKFFLQDVDWQKEKPFALRNWA